ncbi:hypothetical protein Tco_0122479 [Tanacetum coccineum]
MLKTDHPEAILYHNTRELHIKRYWSIAAQSGHDSKMVAHYLPLLYCKNGGATDEFVNEPAVKNCEAKSSKEEPKLLSIFSTTEFISSGVSSVTSAELQLLVILNTARLSKRKGYYCWVTYYCWLKVNAARHNLLLLDDIQARIDIDHQLVERLQAQEQEELSDAEKATLFQQLLEKRRKHFTAKKAEEKRNKPPTKAQHRQIMCTYLKNMEGYKLKDLKSKGYDSIQEMFDRAFKRQKVDDDKETKELKQCMEIIPDEEEVTINAIPFAVKIFSQMLKSFDREDLEDLYKLVKARYGSTRPVESMDYLLWNDMKIMFEPHIEDEA